jgi:hypothetical protein
LLAPVSMVRYPSPRTFPPLDAVQFIRNAMLKPKSGVTTFWIFATMSSTRTGKAV